MKVIKEKTFTVKYLVPENETEAKELKKIIDEAEKTKLSADINKWEVTDNRNQKNKFSN